MVSAAQPRSLTSADDPLLFNNGIGMASHVGAGDRVDTSPCRSEGRQADGEGAGWSRP